VLIVQTSGGIIEPVLPDPDPLFKTIVRELNGLLRRSLRGVALGTFCCIVIDVGVDGMDWNCWLLGLPDDDQELDNENEDAGAGK